MPPPDGSVIDPRDLLDIDDLPEWLQAVALRETGQVETNPDAAPDTGPRAEAEPTAGAPQRDPEGTPAPSARPYSPLDEPLPLRPPAVAPSPWWMSDGVMGGLLVAIILTLIYVLLVASDVL